MEKLFLLAFGKVIWISLTHFLLRVDYFLFGDHFLHYIDHCKEGVNGAVSDTVEEERDYIQAFENSLANKVLYEILSHMLHFSSY